MIIETLTPSIRQGETERLVRSLLDQTRPPDIITIISNETEPFPVQDGRVRLLRYASDVYCVGEFDATLRRNVGAWSAEGDVIVWQDDDQIAPPTLIEDSLSALEGKDYLWGNHRLTDFEAHSYEEIRSMSPEDGESREHPVPPAMHGHWSCYCGMFVVRTAFLREVGGFDMAFNGNHYSEDQQLGYRLMRRHGDSHVFIHGVPFSWHAIGLGKGTHTEKFRSTWLPPRSNGCGRGNHLFRQVDIGGTEFLVCTRCPYQYAPKLDGLFREEPVIRYRPEVVDATSVWLQKEQAH